MPLIPANCKETTSWLLSGKPSASIPARIPRLLTQSLFNSHGKLIYGVSVPIFSTFERKLILFLSLRFGDSNGATPEVIGEGSWLLGQKCFPTENTNGGSGHGAVDVTCKPINIIEAELKADGYGGCRHRFRQSPPIVCDQQKLHHQLRHVEDHG